MPKLLTGFLALFWMLSPLRAFGAEEELVTVRVDGRAVLQVGPIAGTSARDRAARVERRLTRILNSKVEPGPPQIARSATNSIEKVISFAGVPVVNVAESDAQEHLTTVDQLAAAWAHALQTAVELGRERRLTKLARFRTEIQGSVTTAFSRLTESAIRIVPRAIAALLVIALFWIIASLVRWGMRKLFCWVVNDLTAENLIKQVAYYSVWALGLIMAADAFGLDARTVITGLGLTSLALGFALKDILSNFVSGILILGLRPFRLGDQIVVGDTEGSVERIQLRATQVRTYDGRTVLVPNAEVFTSRITNNTESPVRRASIKIYVGYDQNLQKAIETVLRAASKTEGVMEDPHPSVRVQELGPSDVLLEARFWTDSRRSDFVATCSQVRQSVTASLGAAGIALPNPDMRKIVFSGERSPPAHTNSADTR